MSVNLSKGPIWGVAVIVGLIVATALVAGYADRPSASTCSQVAASKGDCAACPAQGTEACCKESGTCPKASSCSADTVAATCPAGAAMMARTAEAGGATCPVTGAVMAQTAEDAGATCPMKAAAEAGQCSGGQCPASK